MSIEGLESIAVIGMAGRFPGANNVQEFWQNLMAGKESLTTFSDAEILKAGANPALLADPNYIKSAPIIENAEYFDASFFGFSAREAEITDPQQRIFLECAWEALEDAGYCQENANRSVGLYAGVAFNGYLLFNLAPYCKNTSFTQFLQYLVGNDKDYLATHTSYKLNLRGPSMVVQTACSSSLVAIAQACQSLLNYQCDMALAGGVTVRVPRRMGYLYEEGGVCARDGHCRPFAADASGTIYGDGVGIVVLKRLDEALKDNDNIYAVIKGFGVNNDGNAKIGYTAPSVTGQAAAIAMAQAMADVTPDTITLIEAHGTGTPLGDPIEIAALNQLFAASNKKNYCAIGSVKSNVGHLDGAAGVTSLIKAVLALKYKKIPASINFSQANAQIDFANSPFYVNTTLKEWQVDNMPRRAGVSSFGFGGTNAHIILEEINEQAALADTQARAYHLLTLSAKTPAALQQLARRYYDFLQENPAIALGDICFTANTGRTHFPCRLAVCGASHQAIAEQLAQFTDHDITATQNALLAQASVNNHPAITQLITLAERYLKGENIDWLTFNNDHTRKRVSLPTYPFESQRYWIDPPLHPAADVQALADSSFYEITWLPQPLTKQIINTQQTWLIFADKQGIAENLQQHFAASGIKSISIKPGADWTINSATEWCINPVSKADWQNLTLELGKNSALAHYNIIYLWGLDASQEITADDLLNEQTVMCGGVINIFQQLEKYIHKFYLITVGAMLHAHSANVLGLKQTTLIGLSKVIAFEYPNLWGGLIDLDPIATLTTNVNNLAQEVINQPLPDYISYRAQQRLVARLTPCTNLPAANIEFFEPAATYLITGGLGGLGLKLAAWLVEQGVRSLVLIGRTAAGHLQQATIQALRDKGCNVMVMQADVSKQRDVAALLEKTAGNRLPLAGIFHLAGRLDLATINQLNWQAAEQVLAPKVLGAWHLHEMTRHLPLKFFVMFSSMSSSVGALGTAAYASANAFLDGLAYYRRAMGLPALTINWGPWAEAGMATALPIKQNQQAIDTGIQPLTAADGLNKLQQLLQANVTQMTVAAIQWDVWQQYMNLTQPFFADLIPAQDKNYSSARTPAWQALLNLPSAQQKQRLLQSLQELIAGLLKMPATVLPDIQQPFTELGMDSLMAIELRKELELALGKPLSTTLMFNYRNIATLADYLLAQFFSQPAQVTPLIKTEARATEFTNAEIAAVKRLSDAQILQEIAKEMSEI